MHRLHRYMFQLYCSRRPMLFISICIQVGETVDATVHRAVSPTLCVSYSHTVLSRFTINGVSTVGSSSGTPEMQMRALEFKWCMAICDGSGGVCMPLICTCGILWCRTPMVPPYVGQWWAAAAAGWRGSVHVDICVAYTFGPWFWNYNKTNDSITLNSK